MNMCVLECGVASDAEEVSEASEYRGQGFEELTGQGRNV